MKRRLNEEEYNQVIKLGVCGNKHEALDIVNNLKNEGIDSYNEGNVVYISVEQDKNNPHYVDDVKEYAMNMFKQVCGNTNKMKLACSKQKNMKITESKLKKIIKEAVLDEILFGGKKRGGEKPFDYSLYKKISTELYEFIEDWWHRNFVSEMQMPREKIMKFVQELSKMAIE